MIEPSGIVHHTVYVGGIRFHYVQAGTGKRLVLLLHGFPEFWYSWRQLIATLGPNFTVVAPDLRGYNLTDRPDWGYELDVLAQDVVGLIDALGFTRAVVVGHDWGGIIAWATAILHPQRVEQLVVLNCPHPEAFADQIKANPRQILRSWYIGFFQIPWLPETAIRANLERFVEQTFRGWACDKRAFTDQDLAAYRDMLAQPGQLTAAINYYRALPHSLGVTGSGMVLAPTLMIWGEEDRALGKELTYETGRYVPDLRITYIPNCSHWVQHERPDEVRLLISDFLSQWRD